MDKRSIGKFTDANHMESLHMTDPADYDKKIISLYTQTQLYANDFQQMLDKSTPYYIDSNSEAFKWDINVPYEFPKVIEIPEETALLEKPGIDGQEFSLVFDKKEFVLNDVITSQKMELATPLSVVRDPVPYNSGWLYTFTLVSENPKADFIHSRFSLLVLSLNSVQLVVNLSLIFLVFLPWVVRSHCLNLLVLVLE